MTDAAALIAKLRSRLEKPPASEAEGVKLLHFLDQLIEASSADERRWFQEAKGRYLLDFPFGDPMLHAELAVETLCQSVDGLDGEALAGKFDTCKQIAIAYHLRRAGTARENLELAIRWAHLALRGAKTDQNPDAQGEAHLLLGELFVSRLEGERLGNLDEAEKHYLRAAELFDPETAPGNWSRAQLGWANVLAKPVLRHRTERLRLAVTVLEDVASHLKQHPDTALEIDCLMKLGVALAQLPDGDKRTVLERAIRTFKQVALLCWQEGQLTSWAQSQHNLGNAYLDQKRDSKTMNTARAIVHFGRAVDVYRSEGASHRRAQTLNSLGTAFWELHEANPRYLHRARETLEEATELRLRLGRIDEALRSAHNLTRVLAAMQSWDALLTLGERVFFDNDVKLSTASSYAEAERLISEFGRIVDMMALANLERDGAEAALDTLVRGRARLVEMRAPNDGTSAPPQLRDTGHDELLVVSLVPLPPNPIRLILIFRNEDGQQQVQTERLDGFSQYDLEELIYGGENAKPGWIKAYQAIHLENDRKPLAAMLDVVAERLGRQFSSVVTLLDANPHLQRITWAPSGALSVFPLGRCQMPDGAPIQDRTSCRVATSLRAAARTRANISQGRVVSFADPDGSLPFGRSEGEALKTEFPQTELLIGPEATRASFFAALANEAPINLLHLSCHGRYRWSDPSSSQLMFSDGPITVAEIRDEVSLSGAPLVILSACEVGITDFRQLPTETFGMPSVWLSAGASGVIAPLWPISDFEASKLVRNLFAEFRVNGNAEQVLSRALKSLKADQEIVDAAPRNRWTEDTPESVERPNTLIDRQAFQLFIP